MTFQAVIGSFSLETHAALLYEKKKMHDGSFSLVRCWFLFGLVVGVLLHLFACVGKQSRGETVMLLSEEPYHQS